MGDVADMILEGVLCACGSALDGDSPGHPRYCSKQCAKDYGPNFKPAKVRCPECQRSVKKAGLADHIKAAHTHTPADAGSLEKLRSHYGN